MIAELLKREEEVRIQELMAEGYKEMGEENRREAEEALNEQCFEYNECDTLLPFIDAGKPVFNVEYELDTGAFCERANTLGFSSMKKSWNLDAWREPCH